MNSAEIARGNNVKFFFFSLFIAILLVSASGFLLFKSLSGDTADESKFSRACTSVMKANGFNPNTVESGIIKVALNTESNIESLVYKSGVIIASCPTYTLLSYCAGAGCLTPGVNFTLKLKEL